VSESDKEIFIAHYWDWKLFEFGIESFVPDIVCCSTFQQPRLLIGNKISNKNNAIKLKRVLNGFHSLFQTSEP
jgi:hypothetical protein